MGHVGQSWLPTDVKLYPETSEPWKQLLTAPSVCSLPWGHQGCGQEPGQLSLRFTWVFFSLPRKPKVLLSHFCLHLLVSWCLFPLEITTFQVLRKVSDKNLCSELV